MGSWIQRQLAKFDPESLKPRNTLFKTSPVKDTAIAFFLALIIIAGEFTFRRIVAMLLPTYFDYFFMDLLCLGGIYLIICPVVYLLQRGDVRQKACYADFSLRDIVQRNTVHRYHHYCFGDSGGQPP